MIGSVSYTHLAFIVFVSVVVVIMFIALFFLLLDYLKMRKMCIRDRCKIEKVDDFRLEEDEAERLLIRIKKCKGTPKLYPRKAGTPSKNPL